MCEGVVSWCVVTGWDQQSGCVRVWYAGVLSRGGASSVDVRVCRKLVSCHWMGPAMWMYEGVVSWCVVMGWGQQCGCVRVS